MITIKKLNTLKERTKLRKISIILHKAALDIKHKKSVDLDYIINVYNLGNGTEKIEGIDKEKLPFVLEDLSQKILTELGAEPSDWDFTDDEGELDSSLRIIQDKILILDRIRSPFNVGSIFRCADSFGIKKIILLDGTADPRHSRSIKTSRGCIDTVKWEFLSEQKVIELLNKTNYEIMALELGGENINSFNFPSSGIVIVGSEEFGISPFLLEKATKRLSIPMGGTKGSLNVSTATGILLEKWFSIFSN